MSNPIPDGTHYAVITDVWCIDDRTEITVQFTFVPLPAHAEARRAAMGRLGMARADILGRRVYRDYQVGSTEYTQLIKSFTADLKGRFAAVTTMQRKSKDGTPFTTVLLVEPYIATAAGPYR